MTAAVRLGSRLLDGVHGPVDLAAHLAVHGPLPDPAGLVDVVEAAGLRGRGGAAFPTARKLRAVRPGRRPPLVVANGCESEPMSGKDALLLALVPHLVLDGAVLAALAVGAPEVVLCVPAGRVPAGALAERGDPVAVRVVEVPHRFVASEATALVRFVGGGPALPTTRPPHTTERGAAGRPTLVDNVETLARIALLARHGAVRFRADGTDAHPGAVLLSIGGAVVRPGVYETPAGISLGAALDLAGGPATEVAAVLTGGYGGTWVPVPELLGTPLTGDDPRVALGSGVLVALPATACGIAQTLHVLRYLAAESAGQCGPCRFGLPALVDDLADIVGSVHRGRREAHERLTRRLGVVAGRGACAHPDGAVRLTATALEVFAEDVEAHLRGRPCPGAGAPSLFPTGGRP